MHIHGRTHGRSGGVARGWVGAAAGSAGKALKAKEITYLLRK